MGGPSTSHHVAERIYIYGIPHGRREYQCVVYTLTLWANEGQASVLNVSSGNHHM